MTLDESTSNGRSDTDCQSARCRTAPKRRGIMAAETGKGREREEVGMRRLSMNFTSRSMTECITLWLIFMTLECEWTRRR